MLLCILHISVVAASGLTFTDNLNTHTVSAIYLDLTTGGIIALAVYNFFLFFSFRDSSYLHLVGFILVLLLEADHRILKFLCGPDCYLQLHSLPAMLAIIFGLSFFRQILQSKLSMPVLDKVLLHFTRISLAAILILPFTAFHSLVPNLIGLILLPVVLVSTYFAVRRGVVIAHSLILAVLVLLAGALPNILIELLVIKAAPYLMNSLNFGLLGFIILLSLTQVELTQQLRKSTEIAQVANQAKTDFITTISHELRTPMTAINGINALLRMTPLDREQQDYLNKLEIASGHMLNLIENILDFSRIEQTGIDITYEPFQLADILQDIQQLFSDQAKSKGLDFNCHQQFDKCCSFVGDATRLTQILLNLTSNAIKFTKRGSVDLIIHELAALPDTPLPIYFEIRDTGIGIAKDELPRLFQPFSQANSFTSKRFGGSGLGLAISQRLIQAMGGKLQVISELGTGSRFFFTLKFARQVKVAEPTLFPQVLPTKDYKHVLIVDDDEINRFVASRFLKARHFRVSLAANGQAAINTLNLSGKQSLDLVFMDVSMQEMDGYETTRQIRSLGFTNLPIVALTAHALSGERERCLEAGMNDLLTKPFELQELEKLIHKWT